MGPLIITVALALLSCCSAQRVAPGVPPQQYQQQHVPQQQVHQGQFQQQQQQVHQQQLPPNVHPGHYQQPQQGQFQQQMPQHQQVPQQQHHQQVPVQQQQVPVQPQHGAHHPQGFNPGHINEHERQHIQEHAEVPIDTSKMSEQELQFHYFKMHDADHNNKLDGCELIKSLIHYHEQGSKEGHAHGEQAIPQVEEKIFSDEELVALIDPILQMDDINKDGFIDYPEFIRAQQKAQQKN